MNLFARELRTPKTRNQAGSSVIIVTVLLGIVMMYVAANLKTLGYLKQELNLLERKQVERLKTAV